MKANSLDYAITRFAVASSDWRDIGGGQPYLPAFLAGWFACVCKVTCIDGGTHRDSFNRGWKEAESALVIEERERERETK